MQNSWLLRLRSDVYNGLKDDSCVDRNDYSTLKHQQRANNLEFATGQLPDDWRTANITAIYKKGSKTDPSNYRPSLTSIICKIMESIIRDDILNYFLDNGLFSKTQYMDLLEAGLQYYSY